MIHPFIGLLSGKKDLSGDYGSFSARTPLNGPDTENPERMGLVEVPSDELKPIPASIVGHTTNAGG